MPSTFVRYEPSGIRYFFSASRLCVNLTVIQSGLTLEIYTWSRSRPVTRRVSKGEDWGLCLASRLSPGSVLRITGTRGITVSLRAPLLTRRVTGTFQIRSIGGW